MTIEHEQWERMLSAIDADKNLSKDNVIGKIKEKLSQYSDEYKEWEGAGFGVNHLFAVEYGLLHLAIHNNLENVVNALLGVEGINANAKNGYGDTPLCKAARRGCTKTIRALIDNGADVNEKDNHECTPLHLACENGQTEVVNLLLKREDIDVNAISKDGYTPLHLVASHYSDEGIVKALIENGADVNAKNQDRCTPLHCAVRGGYTRIVKALIGNGADVKVVNKNGSTPLHLAASRYNDEKIVKALLKVEEVDINALDENEWTPLHLAARDACEGIVKILIENGADVNAANKDGSTPLHLAATHNKWVVGVLIDKKSDLFSKDNEGRTPRDLAEDDDTKKLLKVAEEKQLEKLSKKTDLPQDDKDTTRLLGKTEPTSAIKNGIIAGCATAALSTAIAVTLFATGTVAVELMSVMIAAAIITAAALAVGGITYSILKPSTKMDETKEAQNVNGNVQEVFP
ncbi:ankyrin repeat domain-containing protein [Wolbachia endosymbiont (group A) of Pogonocherus hispidulus]|uniref:ankyrin repeat domain-containing protein n=1 Tax=Wolbachia endosymbiont (group A) of Pogonocherus hispidulus TaxID=3066136 RepID=UPI0033409688